MSKIKQGSPAGRKKRNWKWLLLVPVVIPVAWLGLDFSYSLLMQIEYASWEAGIQRDPDGVRRGCREFTLGEGDTALLLVHGFSDSPAVFRRMAPALAERGFLCRAMRLPLFATPLDSYGHTSAAQWRQAVRDELRHLRAGHRRVILVAHSLGAAVALDALAGHADAVDGTILLAPLVEVADHHLPLMAAQAWFHVLDHLLLFTDRIGIPSPGGLVDQSASTLMKTDSFIPRSVFRELFAVIERNRRRVAALRSPMLMVLAGQDDVVDNHAAEGFFQRCSAPYKRLCYLPAAGHILPMDTGWQAVVDDISQFLTERHLSPRLALGQRD
jgi:carboxylesterase